MSRMGPLRVRHVRPGSLVLLVTNVLQGVFVAKVTRRSIANYVAKA